MHTCYRKHYNSVTSHALVTQMVKNLPSVRLDLIRGFGRFPGGGLGNPFQYSCLENPTDRGTWQATVHGVAKSQTRVRQTEQLSTGYFFFYFTILYWFCHTSTCVKMQRKTNHVLWHTEVWRLKVETLDPDNHS